MKALLEVIRINSCDCVTTSNGGGACSDPVVGGDCSTDGF